MIKKCTILFFACFWTLAISKAQTQFELTTGDTANDLAGSIIQTIDGGYLAGGATLSFGNFVDGIAWKLNANGNISWAKTYGKYQFDRICSVLQTMDGNYAFTGTVVDTFHVDQQGWFFKTDTSGNIIWSKTYGNAGEDYLSTLRGITETADSGFALLGTTNFSNGTSNIDLMVIRTDKNGDTLWTKIFRGLYNDQASEIATTADGGFVICGRTNSFGNFIMDAFLLKLDANGNTQWANRYGDAAWDEATGVHQTSDLGFVVCGSTTSFGPPDYDAMIFKTDSVGNLQWTTVLGDSMGFEALYGILQTNDGGFVSAGFAEGYSAHRLANPATIMGNDSSDVYILKLDASGDTIWNYLYGGYRLDEAYCISQANDGGFLTAAYSQSFTANNNWQGYLIKTDSLGNSCTSVAVSPPMLHPNLLVDSISFIELNDIVVDNYNMIVTPVTTSDSLFCIIASKINLPQKSFYAKAYPNPFQNKITIDLDGDFNLKDISVKFFDIAGRDVSGSFSFSKNNHNKVSCRANNNLTPGFYMLSIMENTKRIKTFKVINRP